ncbi:MAG: hypothetical protein HY721_19990 [Planctomycetes bacterium]|nr:hypothetical protein [Planctomycetota bacterium]
MRRRLPHCSSARLSFRVPCLGLLGLPGLATVLASCGSSPPPRGAGVRPALERGGEPDESRARPAETETGTETEKVFYNLTPVTLSPAEHPSAQPAARTLRPQDAEAVPAAPRSLDDLPDAALVSELQHRWTRRWTALSGGLGKSASTDHEPARREASRHVLALCFLREDHGSGDPIVAEALASAAQDDACDDNRLLAAACLKHAGMDEELHAILETFAGRSEGPAERTGETEDEAPAGAPFEVVGLTFARSIEGPGKYEQLDGSEIAPGRTVLIYGEFKNFLSVAETHDRSAKPSYRRAFAAELRVLSPEGEEIDRLVFLPEKRGHQTAPAHAEVMNFWARYRIPASLQPGQYQLVVEARDVLAGSTASAEMPFEVQGKGD